MQIHSISSASALSLALAAALPVSAQAAQAELYLDVATHSMPGMPGMGAMGRLAGAMGADTAGYGMTRYSGMPGKYLDVALHNRNQPGAPATQAVPGGLGVGASIPLLAPAGKSGSAALSSSPEATGQQDGTFKVRYYWGCGEQVRSGQPAEFTVTVRNGKPLTSGRAMQPRTVPTNGIDAGPQYALWPNPSSRKTVGAKASLAGTHQVTGEALPAAMRFELGREHDFLPELKPRREGDADQGMTLRWDGVDGARAYFAHAAATEGDTMVMWSSSEDGYAGQELIDYLPESLLVQWTGKRTLMGADARDCRIPRGVFAGSAQGAPMVQMIAYGNERSLAEPRPDNAPRDWSPAWTVRVRSKSTAMLVPGMAGAEAAGKADQPDAREGAKNEVKDAAKSLLRGLIRR